MLTVSLSTLIGGSVGIVAGSHGHLVDDVPMRLVDMLLATPTFYLLILPGSLLPVRIGPVTFYHDPVSISILLATTSWGGVARLLRGATLAARNDDFMLATGAGRRYPLSGRSGVLIA
jgi:ABC-type dipeptide/oligopeptide/nickel transport system permease subunit